MKLWLLAIFSIFLVSCSSIHQKTRISWLKNYSAWEQQSAGKPYSIQKDEKIKRHKESSIRFELRKDDGWMNHNEKSFRSEISMTTPAQLDSEQWYGFSIFIPTDFPIENNRLVITQWWAPTKKTLGEKGKSPALAFRYESGKLFANVKTSPDRIVRDNVTSQEMFSIENFPKGVWQDFVAQVRWSYKSDGFVKIWNNQKQIANYSGPVGYNDDLGPIMKFGIYRDNSNQTYILNIGEVRQGSSYAEVDPSISR